MMGRSIATKVAQAGLNVSLKELSQEALESTRQELERSLDHEIARFGLTASEKKAILSRIRMVTTFDAIGDADLAIETVQEDRRSSARSCASSTAGSPPTTRSSSTLDPVDHRARVRRLAAGADPRHALPLPGDDHTGGRGGPRPADLRRSLRAGHRVRPAARKVPIKVFEMPGFVTTRVALPLVNEAMHVVMEGSPPRPRSTSPSSSATTSASGHWSGRTAPVSTAS